MDIIKNDIVSGDLAVSTRRSGGSVERYSVGGHEEKRFWTSRDSINIPDLALGNELELRKVRCGQGHVHSMGNRRNGGSDAAQKFRLCKKNFGRRGSTIA